MLFNKFPEMKKPKHADEIANVLEKCIPFLWDGKGGYSYSRSRADGKIKYVCHITEKFPKGELAENFILASLKDCIAFGSWVYANVGQEYSEEETQEYRLQWIHHMISFLRSDLNG